MKIISGTMKVFSGTISWEPGGLEAMQAFVDAGWAAQLKRIKALSLASGMEAIYDLSSFDYDWSPIFFYTSDDPIAWINIKTGERRADRPEELR